MLVTRLLPCNIAELWGEVAPLPRDGGSGHSLHEEGLQ